MSTQSPITEHRLERVLAYMVAATIGLSVVCMFAVLIGTAVGAAAHDGFSHGIWPVVFVLPMIGLPLGFLLLIVLLVLSWVRRGREARRSGGSRRVSG